MTREIGTVGVVGLGTMGAGIAEVFARSGVPVVACEVDASALARGRATLTGSTERAVARGRMTPADRDALLDRVRFAAGLPSLREVDLVVEAVPERLEVKQQLFAELDQICQPRAILATNTSSLSVTEVAAATSRPAQVLGMHFFNPAPVMKLVEVVRTVVTEDDVVDGVAALCGRLGKTAVTVGDNAGFIANGLLFGYLNDAVAMLERGFASREDIDTAMRLGAGLPMGPLTLLDLIGLDTAYQILDTMYRRGGRDRRHAPAPLLRQLVTAGLLGRKTGRGLYTYQKPGSPVVVDAPPPATDAPPPATVGVVGDDALAEALGQGGYEVVAATRPEPEPLASAGLIVVGRADPGDPVIATAMATGRPSDVVGMQRHGESLVEIVRTVLTSPGALATARAAAAAAGLTGVTCGDRAGFIVNALLLPYLNDAVRMYEAGYAGVDDIDAAMTLGCGYPEGPFAMLDSIGLDRALAMQRAIYSERREPGVAPAPLWRHLVTAGLLGRASGRGFRDHSG